MLAWYMILERLGADVHRSNRVFVPNTLKEVAVVFLIDPTQPIHPTEREDLSHWISQGGVLVTTESMKDIDPALDRLSLRGSSTHYEAFSTPSPTGIRATAQRLPLARDISAVCFGSNQAFELRAEPSRIPRAPRSLLTDDRGVRIVGHRMGLGCVIVLSDSSFMTNGLIDRDDNSVLAANLVAYATTLSGGEKILFDDYHFHPGGPGQGLFALGGMLFTTSAGWCVLTLTVAGILFLILKGRQFGPRRDFRRQQRRRSKLEYVYAVGATYRAAGAHGMTFQLIYNWFRQESANRTHLPPTTTNRLLAQGLAQCSGSDPAEYEHTLDACDAMLSKGSVSQRQLAAATEKLARIEKEALHGSDRGARDRR